METEHEEGESVGCSVEELVKEIETLTRRIIASWGDVHVTGLVETASRLEWLQRAIDTFVAGAPSAWTIQEAPADGLRKVRFGQYRIELRESLDTRLDLDDTSPEWSTLRHVQDTAAMDVRMNVNRRLTATREEIEARDMDRKREQFAKLKEEIETWSSPA